MAAEPREPSVASVIFPEISGLGFAAAWGRLPAPVTLSASTARSSLCCSNGDRPGPGSTILAATFRLAHSPPDSRPSGRMSPTAGRGSCTVWTLSTAGLSLSGLFPRVAPLGERPATRGTKDPDPLLLDEALDLNLGEPGRPGLLDLGPAPELGARTALPEAPPCEPLRGLESRTPGVPTPEGVEDTEARGVAEVETSEPSLGARTESSARVQACSSSLLFTWTPVRLPLEFSTKPLLMISRPRMSLS
mmetsp:Transcript_46753/g.146565  ORF Transcript_46753/g.146565 Transcript_46753/m.146565 type:complete len:248 (-) Transcript_46753:906-1649(-)